MSVADFQSEKLRRSLEENSAVIERNMKAMFKANQALGNIIIHLTIDMEKIQRGEVGFSDSLTRFAGNAVVVAKQMMQQATADYKKNLGES